MNDDLLLVWDPVAKNYILLNFINKIDYDLSIDIASYLDYETGPSLLGLYRCSKNAAEITIAQKTIERKVERRLYEDYGAWMRPKPFIVIESKLSYFINDNQIPPEQESCIKEIFESLKKKPHDTCVYLKTQLYK